MKQKNTNKHTKTTNTAIFSSKKPSKIIISTLLGIFSGIILLTIAIIIALRASHTGTAAKIIPSQSVVAFIEAKTLPTPFVLSQNVQKVATILTNSRELAHILTFDNAKNIPNTKINGFLSETRENYLILARTTTALDSLTDIGDKLESNPQFIQARAEVPSKNEVFLWINTDAAKKILPPVIDTGFPIVTTLTTPLWDELASIAAGVSISQNNQKTIRARIGFKNERFITTQPIKQEMANFVPKDFDFFISGHDLRSEAANLEKFLSKKSPMLLATLRANIAKWQLNMNFIDQLFQIAKKDWMFALKTPTRHSELDSESQWIIAIDTALDNTKLKTETKNIENKLKKYLAAKFPKKIKTALPDGRTAMMLVPNDTALTRTQTGDIIELRIANIDESIAYILRDSTIFISNSLPALRDSSAQIDTLASTPAGINFAKQSVKYRDLRGFISAKILNQNLPEWLICSISGQNIAADCKIQDLFFAKWATLREDFWVLSLADL